MLHSAFEMREPDVVRLAAGTIKLGFRNLKAVGCGPGREVLISWEKAMERAKGIEPSYAAWEAAVLPLNYARLDTYQPDLAETAPSAKRLGGLSRRNLNLVRIF